MVLEIEGVLDRDQTQTADDGDIPDELMIGSVEVINTANVDLEETTRIEPRYNVHGKLRGLAWRTKNKERRNVYYVGPYSKGERKTRWEELHPKWDK